jgi:hypothetical protein
MSKNTKPDIVLDFEDKPKRIVVDSEPLVENLVDEFGPVEQDEGEFCLLISFTF